MSRLFKRAGSSRRDGWYCLHLEGNIEDALATLAGWLTSLEWCMYIKLRTLLREQIRDHGPSSTGLGIKFEHKECNTNKWLVLPRCHVSVQD